MAEKCISTIKESSVVCDLLFADTKESEISDEACDQNGDNNSCDDPIISTVTSKTHIPSIINLNDTTSPNNSYTLNATSALIDYMSQDCETRNGQTITNCEKVDIYLETPVVDDNNESFGTSTTTTTVNAIGIHASNIVPKRLSDEFYSADDCYSDNEDVVKETATFLKYNDNLVTVDEKSITPNSNVDHSAEMSRFEDNSIDNLIETVYIEDDTCSNHIDISNEHDDSSPHSTASPGIQDNGEDANHGDEHLTDRIIYYANDIETIDAIERKNFELEEKITDELILRNNSLVSGDNRLNLGLLNTFSQKIDQDCSPVDENSQNIDQNCISTTPTSSRMKTMRFGNAKPTAKINLSESLEKMVVADKQTISESDYLNNISSSAGNHSSSSKNVEENNGGTRPIIRLRVLHQHPQTDSFFNSNSNDSLLSFQYSAKKCDNNSESSQSTTGTHLSSYTTNNCHENLNSNHLAIASTSKAAQSSDSSDCTISNSNEIDEATKSYSNEDCMLIVAAHEIKQEIIEEEIIADNDSRQAFEINLPSSSSSHMNQHIDENNYDQSNALMGFENDHDYEEDTWADCEEMSDNEEVCTCRDYSDEEIHGNSEDELPSRDVDLSYYAHLDSLSEDILPENTNSDVMPKNQRKRKITDTLSHDGLSGSDSASGNRKRLALDSVTSPKVLVPPSTPTLLAASPSSHDKRTPRLLIPTRDHPPPELSDWLVQYQRWTHAERLLAIDRLIEHCEPTQVRHMMKVIEPQFQRDFISLLPKELALQVLSYLDPKDLLRAAQTCRSWRFLCEDNLLWKEKCRKSAILMEPFTDKPKRGRAGNMPPISSQWKVSSTIISGSTDRTLKVWDADSGQCKHTLYGHTSTVRCMHLHGNKVVSGSRDATLRVWDIVQGRFLHILVGHLAAVRCVQYDGKLVVSGAYDYMVKVWNPETQECLHTLQGHTNRVYSLQFDGIHVVSGSLDTSIRVWDAETGSCKHTLMGHQSLTSGMELRQNILVSGPHKHQSAVTCLQFNSRFVITSSDVGTVKLWDVKTGDFIRNLVSLDSGGSGGVVWRIRANDTKLICPVGSRNGTEETKLMVLDFDVEGACLKCS